MSEAVPQAVVIGASAGAFDALSRILPTLPSGFRLPIMVVVHIPPDKRSVLAELFRAKCNLSAIEAEDKEPLEGGTIYHLLVEVDNTLALSNDEPVLFSRPLIDVLFESAADVYGAGLIGIILTGANEDGAKGLKAVFDAGGVAIVQDPAEAFQDAMPQAAIDTVPKADILSLASIAAYLQKVLAMDPVNFLLVDDLEDNLLSLEALLRRDDLSLLKARSGDQALELLLQHDVALALIDVQMPGLNGFELAELLRGNERTRRIPIIFVTAGSADERRRFQGYEAGAVDFIQKPIETDVLRHKAEVFFELYRQRQQIEAQRDQLHEQAQALKEADRRKDEFLATLAHELRNPLAPLRNGLDILRRDPEAGKAAEVRDMMDRQLDHLVRLIDDLMDVSRVSQGKIELRREKIKVADVANSAVEASRPFIDGTGQTFELDLPTTDLWIDADQTRLSQVISNLLNNAAKYTPSSGNIKLAVSADAGEAVIMVKDNGVGIPAEMQSDVFRLFAQVGDHRERSQGGLGIGLALVKQLVELHGGTVSAFSDGTDQGSVFSVRIPLTPSPEVAPSEEPITDKTTATYRPLKVLVIDDNPIIADTMGMLLEDIGHEFEAIHDGEEALDAARNYLPDAILLDIGLPGMDGYEVCRVLRQDPLFAQTTIIAQTGWGQDKDKELAREAGFDFHLTKPVPLADLQKILLGVAPRA